MCVYCMIADWGKRWIPDPAVPRPDDWQPMPGIYLQFPGGVYPTPSPLTPAADPGWTREMLEQFRDLLKRVKDIEDKLGGCPCEEPQKLDYLDAIQKRLDSIDAKLGKTGE